MEYIAPLQNLIDKFASIRGVGRKTATRYAFSVLGMSDEDAAAFADAIVSAKKNICRCKICGNLSDGEICNICADEKRDGSIICVVEDERTLMAIEKARGYNGKYHVLGGAISPVNDMSPDKLRINELLQRVNDGGITEVIIATNPTVDGEMTAMYISRLLTPLGVKTTRLAYGVPVGADIENADEVTLTRAIDGRREI
ncbi:MAG: recombination protein RecR [Clostridia bacterium]|nr:recombination protein RecR [Clostridia bacterium]MBO4428558.1 recombination protein RecR [Clostridia bacterium]